ncbi:MAG: nitroreductase family protein [Desulfobacterales bacterium]|nr:nitroreductase family protein [Desulfobacterales bacterium]
MTLKEDTMTYKTSIIDLIQRRKSCRSYAPRPLEPETKDRLHAFGTSLETPFWGNVPRFDLVDVGPPGRGRMPGTYGTIKGAGTFLVGAMKRGPGDMEDFGYLFEQLILLATDLDLATCWIGVTVARGPLQDKIRLQPQETIPAVSPLGYPARRRGLTDTVTRASLGSARRKPWSEMFFDGELGVPLDKQAAGDYAIPLEMVRQGPSATNKQPWRVVRQNGAFHFFLQRAAGYTRMTSAADLQRIDMGIAMCHFELAARELSLDGNWTAIKPWPSPLPKRCEYVVSWMPN